MTRKGGLFINYLLPIQIAAVIIAAIIVIAGLIGVTVYLVDGDRFLSGAAGSSSSREVKVEVTSRTASEDGGASRMFNGGGGGGGADNGLDYQGRSDFRSNLS